MRTALLSAAIRRIIYPDPLDGIDYENQIVVQPIFTQTGFEDSGNVVDVDTALRTVGRFGTTAIELTGASRFRYADTPFVLTDDFTIELNLLFKDIAASGNQYIFDYGANGLILRYYAGTIQVYNGGTPIIDSGLVPVNDKWYHMALVRHEGIMMLFIDGVLVGQAAHGGQITTSLFSIGNYGGGGNYSVRGVIDQPRVTLKALYKSNFQIPTAPFSTKRLEADHDPHFGKVSLLLKSVSETEVADKAHLRELSMVGEVAISSDNRRLGFSSIYNRPSSQGAVVVGGDQSDFNFGSEDFTVECYAKLDMSSSGQRVIVGRLSSTSNGGWSLGINNNRLQFRAYTGAATSTAASILGPVSRSLVPGKWHHIAVARQNNRLYMYIDGVQVYSEAFSHTLNSSDVPVTIGGDSSLVTPSFTGSIDCVRITKGVARYVSIRVPHKLKTEFAEKANGTFVGDVYNGQVSASFDFEDDVSGGYLRMTQSTRRSGVVIDNGSVLFPTGTIGGMVVTPISNRPLLNAAEFTVESFFKTNYSLSTPTMAIAAQWHPTTAGAWMLGVRNKKLVFWYTGTLAIYSSVDVDDDEWHHAAVTLKDGVLRMFVDGVLVGTANTSQLFTYSTNLQIGYNVQQDPPAGYRMNLRRLKLTTGKARYTSGFVIDGKVTNGRMVAA